ncbi:MAG: SPOR domain-containing protein, partial [Epsilonproteobacteria bacterium]|nr:SPOR domain-containing protein [Campylobacterota bacterium]
TAINSGYSADNYIETLDKFQPALNSNSSKISVQVGAFRKYAGAKVYAKRYSLLSDQYNVEIKQEMKDAQPLYKVRIEGFTSDKEAREFMLRYSIDGAFLVRK